MLKERFERLRAGDLLRDGGGKTFLVVSRHSSGLLAIVPALGAECAASYEPVPITPEPVDDLALISK